MSLLSRLGRLELEIGTDDTPRLVVIMTAFDRHEIIRYPDGGCIWLFVPWDPQFLSDDDPDRVESSSRVWASLTDEQLALVKPHDQVTFLVMPPGRASLPGQSGPFGLNGEWV